MEHPSKAAWLGLATAITAYEILAPEDELLSQQFDRWLEHRYARYAAIGGVAITACHLLNIFEHFGLEHLDPLHKLGELKK